MEPQQQLDAMAGATPYAASAGSGALTAVALPLPHHYGHVSLEQCCNVVELLGVRMNQIDARMGQIETRMSRLEALDGRGKSLPTPGAEDSSGLEVRLQQLEARLEELQVEERLNQIEHNEAFWRPTLDWVWHAFKDCIYNYDKRRWKNRDSASISDAGTASRPLTTEVAMGEEEDRNP